MSGKFMMNGIEYLGGSSGGGGGNVDDVYVNGESVLDENKIAQVTSYKEVTLAEYMALPDTKLTDGVMYCIKDVGGANQFPPLIYSDEEREVGVWRDGKPLYQKVISGTASGNFDISTGVISTIDKLVIAHIHIKSSGGTQINNYFMSSSDYTRVRMDANPNVIHVDFGSSYPAKPLEYDLILQYTKTTDTAGSGTWTTDGTYAHHYSTNEKVIGTWIDGKPLYEKTFQFSNYVAIPTKTWTTVMDVSNLSISKLVHCDFIDMEGVYWSGALNRISNGNLQSYVFEAWPVKELTLQYTKSTD